MAVMKQDGVPVLQQQTNLLDEAGRSPSVYNTMQRPESSSSVPFTTLMDPHVGQFQPSVREFRIEVFSVTETARVSSAGHYRAVGPQREARELCPNLRRTSRRPDHAMHGLFANRKGLEV